MAVLEFPGEDGDAGGEVQAGGAGNTAGAGHIGVAGDGWATVEAAGDTVSQRLVRRRESTVCREVGDKCASQKQKNL